MGKYMIQLAEVSITIWKYSQNVAFGDFARPAGGPTVLLASLAFTPTTIIASIRHNMMKKCQMQYFQKTASNGLNCPDMMKKCQMLYFQKTVSNGLNLP